MSDMVTGWYTCSKFCGESKENFKILHKSGQCYDIDIFLCNRAYAVP